MSILIKTRKVKFRDKDGTYHGVSAISEESTEDVIEDIVDRVLQRLSEMSLQNQSENET